MTIPTDAEIDRALAMLDAVVDDPAGIQEHEKAACEGARVLRSLRQQLAAKVSIGDGPAALPVGPVLEQPALIVGPPEIDAYRCECGRKWRSPDGRAMCRRENHLNVLATSRVDYEASHPNAKAEGRGEAPSVPNPNLESIG